METFVLDASALIAFLNDEEGADKAEEVKKKAKMDVSNQNIESIDELLDFGQIAKLFAIDVREFCLDN